MTVEKSVFPFDGLVAQVPEINFEQRIAGLPWKESPLRFSRDASDGRGGGNRVRRSRWNSRPIGLSLEIESADEEQDAKTKPTHPTERMEKRAR